MTHRLRLALGAATLLLGTMAAHAADPGQSTFIGNTAVPNMVLIDPATGQPYKPGASTNPAVPVTAQVKIATSGTPVALPSVAGVNGFIVRSKQSNPGVNGLDCVGPAGVTTVSDGTGNGDCQPPGSGWSFAVSNMGSIYVNGAAGDVFFVSGN